VESEVLPPEGGEALELFYRVRNRVVHGHDANNDDVVRAIDSGIRLLRMMLTAPRTTAMVRRPDIPLYSDPEGNIAVERGSGIMVETREGSGVILRVFPTTRRYTNCPKR
jgi:hypothetical protein